MKNDVSAFSIMNKFCDRKIGNKLRKKKQPTNWIAKKWIGFLAVFYIIISAYMLIYLYFIWAMLYCCHQKSNKFTMAVNKKKNIKIQNIVVSAGNVCVCQNIDITFYSIILIALKLYYFKITRIGCCSLCLLFISIYKNYKILLFFCFSIFRRWSISLSPFCHPI